MKIHPVIFFTTGVVLAAAVLLLCLPPREEPIPAAEESDRQLWLFAQGYQGREIAAQEIIVPAPDDAVFARYIAMQTEQGLSPERCAGQTATRYLYSLEQTGLCAELLVADGRLIGAMCFDPCDHAMRRMNGEPYP